MAGRARPLRLVHSMHSVDGTLLRGNRQLSDGKPEDAILFYNKVLHDLSPGHPCALLNRSLAYTWLGYYELAIADAYRAGMTVTSMRFGEDEHDLRRLRDVGKYLRSEQLQAEAKEEWTNAYARYVGQGWTESPLASIFINDVPNITFKDKKGKDVRPLGINANDRMDVCSALEIRATFRMCGALYMCGGGARAEALGLIDDGVDTLYTEPWERLEFKKLGAEIMEDIMTEVEKGTRSIDKSWVDKENIQSLQFPSGATRDDRMEIVNAAMRDRTILLKSEDYPWTTVKPFLNRMEDLQGFVDQTSDNCHLYITLPHDDPGDDLIPCVEFRADRDIVAGEPILAQKSIFNLVTQEPFIALTDDEHEDAYHQYCDACATSLFIPNNYPIVFEKYRHHNTRRHANTPRGPPDSPTELNGPCEASAPEPNIYVNNLDEGVQQVEKENSAETQESTTAKIEATMTPESTSAATPWPRTPSAHCSPSPPTPSLHQPSMRLATDTPAFMFCHKDHLAPSCSDRCRQVRALFDRGLCGTDIEYELRRAHRKTWSYISPAEGKVAMLHDLIFLRAIVTAMNAGINPLDIPDIAFSCIGPNTHSTSTAPLNPVVAKPASPVTWSLVTHVIRPLQLTTTLLASLHNKDPHARLSITEPYTVNTLLTRIRRAATVSPSLSAPTKFFDEDGMLDATYAKGQKRRWDHDLHEPLPAAGDEEQNAKAVWIGRLETVLNMVRVADASKGEVPNVKVVRHEGVEVFAINGIKKNEIILRPAEDHSAVDVSGEWDSDDKGDASVAEDGSGLSGLASAYTGSPDTVKSSASQSRSVEGEEQGDMWLDDIDWEGAEDGENATLRGEDLIEGGDEEMLSE